MSVLSDVYTQLWDRLGVRRVRNQVVYDDSAPLAKVRRAIVGRPRDERTGDRRVR